MSLGQEVFTDLDFADDVSVMAEMLEVLILALEIMNDESSALGLEINWNKTRHRMTLDCRLVGSNAKLLTLCQGQSFLASLCPKFWNSCFHYLMT